MKLIKLTLLPHYDKGTTLYVNPTAIRYMRDVKSSTTISLDNNSNFEVVESPEAIVALIEGVKVKQGYTMTAAYYPAVEDVEAERKKFIIAGV